jgi:hypothetical protein
MLERRKGASSARHNPDHRDISLGIYGIELLQRCKWNLPSSGMSHSADPVVTDVSKQLIGLIFKGQLAPAKETESLCRNVGNHEPTLRDIPQMQRASSLDTFPWPAYRLLCIHDWHAVTIWKTNQFLCCHNLQNMKE